MKIYMMDKGIVLCGKAWEIKAKLKEYNREFYYVKDWVNHKLNHAHLKIVK
jgi:hypothetical protein